MKPVLFPANATIFTTNGLGRLDPTECIITEELNGQYELTCIVPVDSVHYGDIANNMILAVVPGDGGSLHPKADMQAFRIYQITEPLNGLVTLYARHISYDLSYNTVMPCTAGSVSAALSALSTYAVETCPFTFATDKSTVASWKVVTPQTIRSMLGGQQGSILDVYGGEYDWDNWTVNLWNQRGSDTDVTLRYGKNITDISQEQNLENVVTGIVPFWASEDDVVTLPEKSVDSTYASQYPYKRTVPVDFSSAWEDAPTAAQLRAKAQTYITANNIGVPKVSIKVSFVALWQTEEYKDVAPLERMHLGDTVGVVFEKYGINTRAEVIKTEWDCLAERYLSIELGEARANFANTIVSMNNQAEQDVVEAKTAMQAAIERATELITGNNGGYLKFRFDSDGQPTELLIMDQSTEADSTKIWRWNMGGLGYSSDGGEHYSTAITQAGEIVANFITAGQMSANRVRTGLIESEAVQSGTNVPVSSWDLDSGKFKTVDGEFSGSIENTVVKSSSRTDKTTITGASIVSQLISTVPGASRETTIEGGTITTDNITSQNANIKTNGYSNVVQLNEGKINFQYQNRDLGSIYPDTVYQQDAVYWDANGKRIVITDKTQSGRLMIGRGLDANQSLTRVDIDSPLYIGAQLYAHNSAGLGDYNGYQLTVDGKTLTFKNGILVSVS